MSTKQNVLCGTPQEFCVGHKLVTDQHFSTNKAHRSHDEAFKCYRRYLISIGYKQVGSREFQLGDGPVLVLTKKIRFGGTLRSGKEHTRYEPERGSGLIY